MIDSLYIGATGMNAQQLNIDTVANNLAAPSSLISCTARSSCPAP